MKLKDRKSREYRLSMVIVYTFNTISDTFELVIESLTYCNFFSSQKNVCRSIAAFPVTCLNLSKILSL